jgi:hypothetical protein
VRRGRGGYGERAAAERPGSTVAAATTGGADSYYSNCPDDDALVAGSAKRHRGRTAC